VELFSDTVYHTFPDISINESVQSHHSETYGYGQTDTLAQSPQYLIKKKKTNKSELK